MTTWQMHLTCVLSATAALCACSVAAPEANAPDTTLGDQESMAAGASAATPGAKAMLILGNQYDEVLFRRVEKACQEISPGAGFSTIVLSGGHKTSTDTGPTEAEKMAKLLTGESVDLEGMPAGTRIRNDCVDAVTTAMKAGKLNLYLEESSSSTVANYCYSRSLRTKDQKVLNAGDELRVISTHHHALSVAACFYQSDQLRPATPHYLCLPGAATNDYDRTNYSQLTAYDTLPISQANGKPELSPTWSPTGGSGVTLDCKNDYTKLYTDGCKCSGYAAKEARIWKLKTEN